MSVPSLIVTKAILKVAEDTALAVVLSSITYKHVKCHMRNGFSDTKSVEDLDFLAFRM